MRIDLTDNEHVVLSTRPHWKALVLPSVLFIGACGAVGFALALLPTDASWSAIVRWLIVGAAIVVVGLWSVRPWLSWLTTHIMLTNERLVTRAGILRRVGQDIPLYRVNDVAFDQSLVDRFLRCGTLHVKSGGERGEIVLEDIPRIASVQYTLHSLLDHDSGPDDTASVLNR